MAFWPVSGFHARAHSTRCRRLAWALAVVTVLAGCTTSDAQKSDERIELTRAEAQQAQCENKFDEAEHLLQSALSQTPTSRLLQAAIKNDLAELYIRSGKAERSRSIFENASTLCEGAGDQASGKVDRQFELYRSTLGLARIYRDLGRFVLADQNYKHALDMVPELQRKGLVGAQTQEAIGAEYSKMQKTRKTSQSLEDDMISHPAILQNVPIRKYKEDAKQAEQFLNEGQYRRAENDYLDLLAESEKLFGAGSSRYYGNIEALDKIYRVRIGCEKKGERLFLTDAKRFAQLEAGDGPPANPEDLPDYDRLCRDLDKAAYFCSVQKKSDLAVDCLQRAIKVRARAHGAFDPDMGNMWNELANEFIVQSKWREAIDAREHALTIGEHLKGATHTDLIGIWIDIAQCYQRLQVPDKAIKHLQSALFIARTRFGENHVVTNQIEEKIASAFNDAGDYAQSEKLLRQLLKKKLDKHTIELCHADLQRAADGRQKR